MASEMLERTMAVNPFHHLWDLGYRRLVPIIPPNAEISERSSLAKRPGARGKVPGVRGHDGRWFGFDWLEQDCDEHDLDRWHAMGAGVGIKTGPQPDGTWLVGIDADTLSLEQAMTIATGIRSQFGTVPTRIGRAPKALYVLRLDGPYQYSRIDFDDGSGKPARIEVLSERKQFVAHGTHPDTLQPYHWTEPLQALSDLPVREGFLHAPNV